MVDDRVMKKDNVTLKEAAEEAFGGEDSFGIPNC